MNEVRIYLDDIKSRRHIQKLYNKHFFENDTIYVKQWMNEVCSLKCYELIENNEICALALLSKCDFDPLQNFRDPWILNFIYVPTNKRMKHHATRLLTFLKDRVELTAFTSTRISNKLFSSCHFKQVENNMFRSF